MVFSIRFEFIESRSHIAPKPTPRSCKPITSPDAISKTVGDKHTEPIDTENDSNSSIDRSSGDFSETKKFWQSMETSSHGSIDEQQMPPVPKPRLQSQVPSVLQISDDYDSIEKTNISLVEESVSPSSSIKISSEAQVERSESSSLKSKPEISRDDDSITDRLENESFPRSEKHESDPHEVKLDSLEYDSTERSSSSVYKVKERENILDEDEGTDNEAKSTAFYIGESSGNIITKTATEKRSEFAFDNEAYDQSKDSLEKKPTTDESTEAVKTPHSAKRDSQHEVRFNLEPEEIGEAAYGKDSPLPAKLERVPTGMIKSLDEKCETEMSDKIVHVSPIPSKLQEEDFDGSEKSFGSDVTEEREESHVEISEMTSASEKNASDGKPKPILEPVVNFPEEKILEQDRNIEIEQLDSCDSTPCTEPQTAAVVHSPIEEKRLADEFEYSIPIDTNIYTQEFSEQTEIETTHVLQPTKITETTLIEPHDNLYEDDSFMKPKTAPVLHSPIGPKDYSTASDSIIETEPISAPVAHSPVEIGPNVSSKFDPYAIEPVSKTESKTREKLIDEFAFDFDKPKTTAVVHSPVESSRPEITSKITKTFESQTEIVVQSKMVEEPIFASSGKSELIDDFSFDIGKPKVVHSPVDVAEPEIEITPKITERIQSRSEIQTVTEIKTSQPELVDDFSFDIGKPKVAPVVHSPVESVQEEKEITPKITERVETRIEPATETKTTGESTVPSAGKSELIDDYSFDVSVPKAAAVVNSPIETEKEITPKITATVHATSKYESDERLIDDYSVEFGKPKTAPVLHSPVEVKQIIPEITTKADDFSDKQQGEESSLSTGSKSEVVHRISTTKVAPKTRWSANDPDHSSPSSHNESLENSRPCSSDVENLYVSYPNSSAEYQTALDASSLIPGSTEYHTAVSTLDHSGKTISSQESMKSLDSESSGNLGSVEISEASETLVPSTAELDFDENEQRLSSLDTFGDNLLEENVVDFEHDDIPANMKRSHEMIFAYEGGNVHSIESLNSVERSELSERKVSDEETKIQSETGSDETKFGTSLGDVSNLSMSFSTTSNADTIVENIQDDMASSYGAGSLVGSYETKTILIDESTSLDDKFPVQSIDNLIMTTSIITEGDVTSVNTQITTENQQDESAETTARRKGHKRNDSTSFLANLDMAKLSQESTDSSTSLDEEMIIHDVPEDERKESGSDSDYDRYETEYSRSFKKPGIQRKKKAMAPKSAQKPEPEQLERKKSIPSIETIVEVSEDIVDIEKLKSRGTSQNMLDYSQIPDIMITDDPTKYVSDDEDFEQQKEQPEPEIVAAEQKSVSFVSKEETASKPELYKRQEITSKISHEEYEKLIERQYQTKETGSYEPKADSPTDDSFELIEQPDISDEFVIIEEVAKEAHELMSEGKSVSIQQQKYIKKHDDEVEKMVIKSAPAATNEGSTILQGRHDLAFEFEDSPSSGANTESSEEGAGIESSRKWVEMQLAEQAQNLRYPYDVDRGVLEDIKEEDTDFEIGSSRISSFKDSYSSNDFEAAAARRYHSRDQDNISINSLQEFERLEQAISLENKKFHSSSNDSFSNGSFPKRGLRTIQADEISLSSLNDFEGLENACLEATLLEIRAKEEHALLLSRSDDSNKSAEDGATKGMEKLTTIVTKAEPPKTSVDPVTGQFSTSQMIVTRVVTETNRPKIDLDDDFSSSNLMEVSTDSLEAKFQRQSLQGKSTSQHGSSDSLEISKSVDMMTSSIDSIEISKDGGATGKSSKSDCDSIEQIGRGDKRDSIDSIDAQFAAMTQSIHIQRDSFDANLLDLTSSGIMGGSYITDGKTVTTTSVASSSGYGGGISKDISSDSLNLNQDPELLITSTESLDHTSSTFATYQSQSDSQMTMSGSMTSCDSNTLVDTCEYAVPSELAAAAAATAANLDDKFGVRMTSTTVTTTSAYKTKTSSSEVDKS